VATGTLPLDRALDYLDVNVVALLVRMAVMTYPGEEVEVYDMDQRGS